MAATTPQKEYFNKFSSSYYKVLKWLNTSKKENYNSDNKSYSLTELFS